MNELFNENVFNENVSVRFPVVMSLLGPSLFSPIFLHRNPNFEIVPNSDVFIFDILTYFREFFLLLCWRNARCSCLTIMLKIMQA